MVSRKVQLRLATLILLMISDLDFMFSYLFIYTLDQTYRANGSVVYLTLLVIVCLGQVVYLVGVGYFGPRQKEKIAQQVKDFMIENPDKIFTERWKQADRPGRFEPVPVKERKDEFDKPKLEITMDFPVMPSKDMNPAQCNKKFAQLDLDDPADRERMQVGLGAWGLQDIWDGVEQKNAWNCLKASHGFPMWRLAQYGFQAQPFPKDLSGILNANALYTFACGFVQLVGGVIILVDTWTTSSASGKVSCLVPWTVSFISAVLSIVNVVKDFSAMLVQMENEEDLQKKITVKHEKETREQKDRIEHTHREKTGDIEAEYGRELDDTDDVLATKHAEKISKLAEETDRYILELSQVDDNSLEILEVELHAYRRKLKRVRDLLDHKVVISKEDEQSREGRIKRAMDRTQMREGLQAALEKKWNDALKELTTRVEEGHLSPDEFEQAVEKINAQHQAMKNVMKKVGDMV
jgi:hypothetical protein